MNMFNTDSGFRPPSPLAFTPSTGLFGESVPFEDFKLPGQEFLNLPTSPPPIASDPSMALFNPSEQRYFSEFLDALVIDQDFTFDPSSIPNLPNLPLFTQDNMPSSLGLDNRSYMLPPTSSSAFAAPGLLGSTSMDFDMASPSQSGYVGPQSLPNQGGLGGFSPPPSQQQPGISSGSPSSLHYSTSAQISVPTKRKTNKGADAAGSNRRSVSGQNDSSKISTPIQQLSKLSLNNGPTSSKKNKRDDDDSSVSSPPPMTPRSREHREARDERDPSVSDGSVSDTSNANPTSASSTGASGPATAKRKPYKELLTEEEKRANHIASEQKRRNTIRNGFKDMTDIIPDLRDVNSSKSTILFKAVDFIKQLEKRNRVLQEKANQLESRLINQGKVGAGPGVGANGISGMSGSALDDQRLQDIPHIYPVPCSR